MRDVDHHSTQRTTVPSVAQTLRDRRLLLCTVQWYSSVERTVEKIVSAARHRPTCCDDTPRVSSMVASMPPLYIAKYGAPASATRTHRSDTAARQRAPQAVLYCKVQSTDYTVDITHSSTVQRYPDNTNTWPQRRKAVDSAVERDSHVVTAHARRSRETEQRWSA
jgi:hypothetical protein